MPGKQTGRQKRELPEEIARSFSKRRVIMEITLATESHVPGIVEVWQEFMNFHKELDPRFLMRKDAPPNWEKHLRELMKSGDNQVLVAMDNDHVIGYSISQINRYAPLWERETYGSISDMALKANYRRKGIGEQMLDKIYEWFDARNIKIIELSVAARNQVGYSFWRKHGFQDYMHCLYLDR